MRCARSVGGETCGGLAGMARTRARVVLTAVAALLVVGAVRPAAAQVGLEQGATALIPTDRRPVLLVPGWSDGVEELDPLRKRLFGAGWSPDSVVAVAFDDPVGSNTDHAAELAVWVEGLVRATGAEKVDVVAHSMGGLALRRYLLDGGADRVRRAVFLATPHRGTVSAHLAWGDGARQMEPGSRFLLDLLRGRALPPGVRAITVRTPLDLHVIPNESATLPGVPNLEACCPTHAGLLDDEGTFKMIRRFLESR